MIHETNKQLCQPDFLIITTLFWKGWFEIKFNNLPEYLPEFYSPVPIGHYFTIVKFNYF